LVHIYHHSSELQDDEVEPQDDEVEPQDDEVEPQDDEVELQDDEVELQDTPESIIGSSISTLTTTSPVTFISMSIP